jgi:predicted nucleotidyltransferase
VVIILDVRGPAPVAVLPAPILTSRSKLKMKRRLYSNDPGERPGIMDALADELASHREIVFAYLYGSFAECAPFHDLDVGVYLHDTRSSIVLLSTLARRLSVRLKIPVDVRILNDAPVTFLFHVMRGRLILSHNDDLLSTIMENTVRQYLDIAPLLRRSTKEAFSR